VADTLYADVSEWQVGVNDSYPYQVLCIRSNDGTHRDRRWVNNYGWCLRNADSGRLTFFIVYLSGGRIGSKRSIHSRIRSAHRIRKGR